MRRRWKLGVALLLVLAAISWMRFNAPPDKVLVTSAAIEGDSGDDQVTTSFDGPMVRKRAAIAIHPERGADRAHIRAELQAAAAKAKVGPLADATFGVFSEDMLNYLVPEMAFVLPEGKTLFQAEAFMRDHQPADVAYYLTQPVLVHDLTFAVIPAAGVKPTTVRDQLDAEGILSDSLNRYQTAVQKNGLTVHYFGAVVSDPTIATVREAIGRAAKVPADRVLIEGTLPGPGVELDNGVPNLDDGPHGHH
jgi:hypothetical protein